MDFGSIQAWPPVIRELIVCGVGCRTGWLSRPEDGPGRKSCCGRHRNGCRSSSRIARGRVAGAACIIAGSYKRMKEYLAQSTNKPPGKIKIRKTRFGEILSGMNMGGAYSYDEESYGRFLPLAREEGMKCEDVDFTPDAEGEVTKADLSALTEFLPTKRASGGRLARSEGALRPVS